MGKAKYLAFLLLWAPVARGQCSGQYANDPTYAMLTPKAYAAQGGLTVTQTATASGGVPSHRVTVTAGPWGGTPVNFDWTSNHATAITSASNVTGDEEGGSPKPWNITSYPINSGVHGWQPDNADVGRTLGFQIWVTDGTNTTQDIVYVTVVAGSGPNIVFQDGLDTNFYWQVITTGGGSSMLTSCQECEGGTTQHCINATHTPYSTIQLTNSTSGESQLIQGVQAGNMARSNESLSFSASLAISVLPGDTGTISIDDKIICSADGVIFEQTLPKPKTSPSGGSWSPSVTGELAFTKVALKVPTHCTPLLDSNGNVIGLHCDVAYYCSARSSPPDYQPTGLKTYHYTNPALVPPFWMSMSPGTALVFGRNQPGEIAIWYFPSAELDGVLTGVSGMDPLLLDILSPAWMSDSSTQDCTKWISGISPWYMPKW